jgi:hypothetical protein
VDRVRRSLVSRAIFRRVLHCGACGHHVRQWRKPFEATRTFVFSRHTRCVQCGSSRVRRLPERDRIDRMSTHPVSLLLALTAAPIYHCNPCRLQYRDWRSIGPDSNAEFRIQNSEF